MIDVNEPSDIGKIQEESHAETGDETHLAALPIGAVIAIAVIVVVVTTSVVTLVIVCCLLKSGHLNKFTPLRSNNYDTELQNEPIPLDSANLQIQN